MGMFGVSGVIVMILGIFSMFIQIFINEKKHPQDSSEQNAIMDFVMRSLFLVFDAASHIAFW